MRIKLRDEFKKDLFIFFKKVYFVIFVLCVWYSLAMFQIDILHLTIFGEDEFKVYAAMIGVIIELIVVLLALTILFSIFTAISDSIKYMFIVEPKYKRYDR